MRLNWLFGPGSATSSPAARNESLVEGNTAFAFDLYSRLKGTRGNLFFSPFSISTCLAVAYAGARGETEAQMGRVLRFSKDQARLHSSFGELCRQLDQMEKPAVMQIRPGQGGTRPSVLHVPGIQLSIANALWAQEGHPFLAAFLKIATDEYLATVNQANFRTQADAVTGEINRWVSGKTNYKIQNILPPGSVHSLTRLVLANAIYFKGAWAVPFEDHATSIQSFHLTTNSKADVPLMSQTDDFKYAGSKDFQIIELPYIGGALSMVILLPRRIDGCGQLENQLTPALLSSSLAQMQRQKVEVYLPRFKLESSLDLAGTLAQMGMPDAFDLPPADFSGMDGTRDLLISGIFHKAWGEINEAGTEAAAATAMVMALGCIDGPPPPPPPVFRADHPFIFLIRDIRSGSLLFVGRLADPRAGAQS
ncbi:MAG TPA: serpin family protein [Verrucomicrobiae bacterium]|jgi:serpin B|nr:serpin family protein [Verrucomicrobiae bacterium]